MSSIGLPTSSRSRCCRRRSPPTRTELQNGNVVEIVTANIQQPNPAWLSFVRTGKARSKIRHFLKTMAYDESYALGEKMLQQALRIEGIAQIPPENEAHQAVWDKLLRSNGNRSKQELLADIGMGKRIASGEKLEPHPIAGKPGSNVLKVAAARDDARLYLRFAWKPSAAAGTPMDPDHSARVTVMFDDGSVKEATRAGCWGSCHDDAIGMASAPAAGETTKYLGAARTKLGRMGGGENYKAAADLERARK